LCFPCYYTPGVRGLHPSTSKHGRRGVGLAGSDGRRPPAVPTAAAPGTPEKVAVLVARAERGEDLWHPLDGTVTAWIAEAA
jgi:hypothetical protein